MEKNVIPSEDNEEQSLEYALKARGTNKRNYIFDYGKSTKCNHDSLKSLVKGTQLYRCLDCNYVFSFVAAWQQPLHHLFVQGLMVSQAFSKEFGYEAALEVAHRDLGQLDGTPQKPALPDGMTLEDTWKLFDKVNVQAEDEGKTELKELYEQMWELPSEERKAHIAGLRDGMYTERKALEEKQRAELKGKETNSEAVGEITDGENSDTRDTVSSV
jgi:rubrerythrin